MVFAERYGPWALIAGASEGTGAAFSRKVATQGVNCILVARREGPLRVLAEEIQRDSGVECITVAIDLAAADASDRIISAVAGREVGLFIANAGADTNGSGFLDTDIDNWMNLLNLNVVSTMKCCHHFGRLMRERQRGGIILIGSGVSYGGMKGLATYAGSKSFLLSFGESLWSELHPHGVHVLNLMLGRTNTPAFRHALESKGLPIPAGLASSEEVANTGLSRLPDGPVHNWGAGDDQAGFAPTSAAARRARIALLEEVAKSVMK